MSITVFILLFKRSTFRSEFFMFILGLSICTLSTDLRKFSVGGLRPYFLSICKPDLESICFGDDFYYFDEKDNQTCEKVILQKILEN